MIRIALPNKGLLFNEVKALLEDAGLSIRRSDRALIASIGEDFEGIFVHAEQVPTLVADGAADVGVCGWDLVCEADRDLGSLLDLEMDRSRLVVAAKTRSDLPKAGESCRIATKFLRLTRGYFAAKDVRAVIVPFSRSAEVAPYLGLADFVVAPVSMDSTLRLNGLTEIATVLDSTARLIARKSDLPSQIEELTSALTSVLRARGRRYLIANVPKHAVDRAREVLPSADATVADAGDLVTMHAVIPTDGVYRTVARLKALGCERILVSRIERLMP